MDDYQNDPQWLALCAEVIAKPDDDLPRLVSADWLLEHGQEERSRAIWLYCNDHQFQFVLNEDRVGTRRALGVSHIPMSVILRHHRAYVNKVQCTWAEWEQWGPFLAKRHPIGEVVVTDKQPMPFTHRWNFFNVVTITQPLRAAAEHVLPDYLYHFFPKREVPGLAIHVELRPYPIIQFLTRDQAHTALSAACIAWGRATPDKPQVDFTNAFTRIGEVITQSGNL